ncbi:ribosome biogenesis GTP-binding protein YihA/YsxC [Allofustis seminis]|uniref:ribosome biogenesis GTP-binding protein YihA/YsxC n=1 Tax=Allofustis seminis TaxID=166939 RepID=UPI000362F815|nr:ribosome biogenesis GTP-binding protein YihA/YsxC [Allofustis seminis]
MKRQAIRQAEIMISAVSAADYPNTDLPEIALAGRSNVGKSSLINRIIGRKKLARTSSKPGRTRTLNFYNLDEELIFVDVPGYGYAKVSKAEQNKWAKMMEEYFYTREQLHLAILIIDFRHKPSALDLQMYNFLKHVELPVTVVATKADKVKRNQWNKQTALILKELSLQEHEEDELVIFSSETGEGFDEVWDKIFEFTGIEEN